MPDMEERQMKKSRLGGRRVCRLWVPATLGSIGIWKSEWDMVSKTES